MNHTALRRDVIDTALEMNRLGINHGKCGNVSVRVRGGFLITPSDVSYERLRVKDVSLVSDAGEHLSGPLPSTEWALHMSLLRLRKDSGAVVHAHPVYATALSCMGLEIPAFHYRVATLGGDSIPCAEYATFGTNGLALNVARAMQGRSGCLMANHGIVATGRTLHDALTGAEEIEKLAQVYWTCLQVGRPRYLPAAEMATVLGKFGVHQRRPDGTGR